MRYVEHKNEWAWGIEFTLVAEDGLSFVSISFESENPGVGYVSGLCVHESARKMGRASEMLELCESIGKREGAFRIDLYSVPHDYVLAFYEKRGFRRVVRRDGEQVKSEYGCLRMFKFIERDSDIAAGLPDAPFRRYISEAKERLIKVLISSRKSTPDKEDAK